MGFSLSKPTAPQPEAPVIKPELDTPWRNFRWNQKEHLKTKLEKFSDTNPDVKLIRIMLAGQIGAGKSSFINSVNSAFQGEIVNEALAAPTDGESFTKRLNVFQISNECGKRLPFAISDIKGLESKKLSGLQVEDVINAVLGHVKEKYEFQDDKPINKEDKYYNEQPSVSEQSFCLVYVIDANTIELTNQRLFEKLMIIRQRISAAEIPQVVVLTKVDEACPLVKKDLRKIYSSKKIKQKMELCSAYVGVPLSNMFPVKNYHKEIDTDDDIDVLILKAFNQIVMSASKRVDKGTLISNE